MKLKMVWVVLVVHYVSACGPLHAADNYIKNGDFEQVSDQRVTFWEVTGTAKPEQVSGGWQRLAGKFNSGAHTSGHFLFFVYAGAMGSIWLDNVVFSPAVSIANASFEELGPDGLPAACGISHGKVAAFSDSSRASEGSRSFRMTHEHEAVPETQLRHKLSLEPNQEYGYSFDVFVGADFQGEALGCVEGLN